jgi:serine kinase of HPr protein (carbohydrate metabolism regulator)
VIDVHGTTVDVAGAGVLLRGKPGSGKSDLALRLIDGGARLVADDRTLIRREGDLLIASAPPTIAGRLEVRGIGIVTMPSVETAVLRLVVDLVAPSAVERLPEPACATLLGLDLPLISLAPFEASAAAKLRVAAETIAR